VVGSCASACRGTGKRKGFRDCATATPDRRRNADVYEETITVFLDAK
jgi:hypothetical protein